MIFTLIGDEFTYSISRYNILNRTIKYFLFQNNKEPYINLQRCYICFIGFFLYEGYHILLSVVRGLIDVVVVLPMSTSWTTMLARAGSILSCASIASRVPSPCGLTVVYKNFPPLNLASRDMACTEWNRQ